MTVETPSVTFLDAPGPVWADGELHPPGRLPDELAAHMGTSLGISPACHLGAPALLEAHLEVLAQAAEVLGYTGVDPAVLAHELAPDLAPDFAEQEESAAGSARASMVVALAPVPSSHRAMPPGEHWMLLSAPFEAPAAEPLRARTSPAPRNDRSPASSVQLLDDTELLAGAGLAVDLGARAALWLDLDGHISCVDQASVVTMLDGQLVTPPLRCGAIRTAWRQGLVAQGLVAERPITPADLVRAGSAACLQPWGSVHRLAAVDDVELADPSVADRLDALVEQIGSNR